MKKKNPQEKSKEKRVDQAPKTEEEKKIMEDVEFHHEEKPTDLEKKFVYEVYDKIAPHFSHTRYKAWPKIEIFLNSLPPGSFVADIGFFIMNENLNKFFCRVW